MKKILILSLLVIGCSEEPKNNNNEVVLYEAQLSGVCTDAYPSQAGYPINSYKVSGDIFVKRINIAPDLFQYGTFITPTHENFLENLKKAEDTFGDDIDDESFDEINKIIEEPNYISIPSLSQDLSSEDSYLWENIDQVYLTQDSWESVKSIHYFSSYDGMGKDHTIDGTCDLIASEQQLHKFLWLSPFKPTEN